MNAGDVQPYVAPEVKLTISRATAPSILCHVQPRMSRQHSQETSGKVDTTQLCPQGETIRGLGRRRYDDR